METNDQARKEAFVRLQTQHYQHFISNQLATTTSFDSSFDHTAKMPITETFFPAFLKACDDDPNDILVIQLTCGICHEQMTLEDGADPQLRAFALRSPCEKGSLIHRDEGKSIALIEDILKLRRNRWYCFNCDADVFTTWLQMLMKISMDCTDVVNDGQFLRICVEYEGRTWGGPPPDDELRLVNQAPLPMDLEVPIKMVEKGLLKAHRIAVPDDGSTVFNYEIRLYEQRDKQDIFLVWERRHIEKMEQEIRDNWLGSRKLMVLDLAYDLRDLWSDENVRRNMEERVERGKMSMMDYIDDVEEAARDDEEAAGDDEDEEPDVYVV
ncbi:hypothetical protein FGLOB1_3359 [Fusarium globosum]|uniref:Uncharacterized protein n=1 Tax=Fusarium globosum TaxID=78864 RepID=A0A8H5YLE5_9HYPO|nr:hypothetical protein FGLOB1_3359 [Fusarium globosum]